MKFGSLYKAYFGADDGAYSKVTQDERNKGQITLTEADGEAQIAVAHFGENQIPRQASAGRKLPVRTINADRTELDTDLTINFPKVTGNELRIYRSETNGFGYEAGDVWFIYVKNGYLCVGSMAEHQWRKLGTADPGDADFQSAMDQPEHASETCITTQISGTAYKRDTKLSKKALSLSGYTCEYDPSSQLFISRSTGRPYLEAHHLIPLYASNLFEDTSLDIVENIVALAPHWHRAIHSAEPPLVIAMLDKLVKKRQPILSEYQLSLDDLIDIYGCGKIA